MPSAPTIFGAGIGPLSGGRSRALSAQRRVNVYAEVSKQPDSDRATIAFFGRPGLSLFSNYGASPVRAWRWIDPYIYVVNGNALYQVNNTGAATLIPGNLQTAAGPVYLSDNGTQLMAADASGAGYIYQIYGASAATGQVPSQGLVQIASGQFLGATWVTYINNRFVVGVPGTNPFTSQEYQISNIGDGTGWNALLFDLADSDPDPLVLGYGYQNILYLFGTVSLERWFDSGQGQQPFQRMPATTQGHGLAAAQSVVPFGDIGLAVLALSREGQAEPAIMDPQGFNPIGSADLIYAINNYPQVSDAVGGTFQLAGHRFYTLFFPSAPNNAGGTGVCWAYDAATGFWQEFSSWSAASGSLFGAFRGQRFLKFGALELCADYANGNVYRLDPTIFQDNGQPMVRQMTSQHLFAPGNGRMFLNELSFGMESRIGPATTPNPQLMLEISRDQGNTFGPIRTAAIKTKGRPGPVFRRAGMFRDGVARVTMTDNWPFVMTDETPIFEQAA